MEIDRIRQQQDGIGENLRLVDGFALHDEISFDPSRFADAGEFRRMDQMDFFTPLDIFAQKLQDRADLFAAFHHDLRQVFGSGPVHVRNTRDIGAPGVVVGFIEAETAARDRIFAVGDRFADLLFVAHGFPAERLITFLKDRFVDSVQRKEQSGRLHFAVLFLAFHHGTARQESDIAIAGAVDHHFGADIDKTFLGCEDHAVDAFAVFAFPDFCRLDAVKKLDILFQTHGFRLEFQGFRVEWGHIVMAVEVPGGVGVAVFQTHRLQRAASGLETVHQFAEKAPDDLPFAFRVARGHKGPDQSRGSGPAETIRAFRQQDLMSPPCRTVSRRDARRAAADYQNFRFRKYGNVPFACHMNRLHDYSFPFF